MKRSLLITALEELEQTTIVADVLIVADILEEVKKIEADNTLVKTDNKLDVYSVGCEYKAGAFIVDSEKALIYKREFPAYYTFLTDWSK